MAASITHHFHGIGLGLRWDFLDEVADAEIAPALPFFEVSPENYMRRGGYYPHALTKVASKVPILTHGLMLNIGSADGPDREYLHELRSFLRRLGARSHTDHLCWNGNNGQTLHDLLPLPITQASISAVVDNIHRVQDFLGVPIGLENISYYTLPGGGTGLAEAEFVAEVLERADCLLLLDINNILVNATNHEFDPIAYLDRLPLARVSHLHVAGGEVRPELDQLIIDTHGTSVNSQCAQLMAEVIARRGPLPVLYERDNNIPPLRELLAEVAQLQTTYDAALTRFHGVQHATAGATIGSFSSSERTSTAIGAIQTLFSRQILASSSLVDTAGIFQAPNELADAPPDAVEVLQRTPGPRLEVYRRLVRNGIVSTIRDFLERSVALVGDQRFGELVNEWLATQGPRSRFLRDIPLEFGDWIARRRQSELFTQLVSYELIEVRVANSPDQPSEPFEEALDLEARVVLHPSVHLAKFDFPFSREDHFDESQPKRENTYLLTYRDAAFAVRTLELSAMGYALLEELGRGSPLQIAVRQSAAQEGCLNADGRVQDDFLARIATLLGDLAQRGVLLGRAIV